MRYEVRAYLYCCGSCEREKRIEAISTQFADDLANQAGWTQNGTLWFCAFHAYGIRHTA